MKARKKTVVVDVERFTADNYETICRFITLPWGPDGLHGVENDLGIEADTGEKFALVIPTLEGDMLALDGDYIIKGVNGEFYPCKPDIFEKTYEIVETSHKEGGGITFENIKCKKPNTGRISAQAITAYHKKMGYINLNI